MLLTIVTPTYNRAYILSNLYESLCNQKGNSHFEWIIIDDDSNDGTDELVNSWLQVEHDFKINYYKQEHGGKHRALNKAFGIAAGEFIFIVDSDDTLTNNAVELIDGWLTEIRDKKEFAGVAGLRVSTKGETWGGKVDFNSQYIDATNFEREKYGLTGDKAEIYRTSILQETPFPEFENEYFVTEAVVFDKIASRGFKLRWYNMPIYICEYQEDGLTKNGANEIKGHLDNYKGYLFYINQCKMIMSRYAFSPYFSEYEKTAREQKISRKQRAIELNMSLAEYYIRFFEWPFFAIIKKCIRKIRAIKNKSF